jgi:hypothetical protein
VPAPRKALACLAVACGLLAGGAAQAAEQTLEYQVVAHTTEAHSLPVPGQSGHAVGIAAFRGLAIFADGTVASHWYSGHFDFVDGSGRIQGYALWVFDDDSRLEAAYVGEATAADAGITFTGTHSDVTGTGRFAGVQGEGRFTGRRVDHLDQGGDTYFRGTLTLTSEAQ